MSSIPRRILLVEDNTGDQLLCRLALKEVGIDHSLEIADNGLQACQRLQDENQPLPDLILLDLNMPVMDGREFLAVCKQDPRLRPVPVVVMTTSQSQIDIAKSYDLQANCFVTKPMDYTSYLQLLQQMMAFWFETATLPQG